ncbi:MAG: hypothetical protein LBU34_07750 [Planctomycetaceae bacterium]|jgi:hypothetical protein|nr:hypothetical protein [Planctomycetaceae bacterium]
MSAKLQPVDHFPVSKCDTDFQQFNQFGFDNTMMLSATGKQLSFIFPKIQILVNRGQSKNIFYNFFFLPTCRP